MRKATVSVLALLCAFGIAAVAPALAGGGERGDWDLGAYGGYGMPDDLGDQQEAEVEDSFLWGVRVGCFLRAKWSLETAAQLQQTEFSDLPAGAAQDVDLDSIRLNALRHFRAGSTLRPFVTAGLGYESLQADLGLDDDATGYNAGGGVRWFLNDAFSVRLDGRWIAVDHGGDIGDQQNLETAIGAAWTFGGKSPQDSDGDGVTDGRDRCPDTPHGASVDERGCPTDADGDGVFDGLDRCPGTPAGTPVDGSGCPKDTDGDGVDDGKDKCPDTPQGATVDATGCPRDTDGDGVSDGLDKCPDTPQGVVVDASGCAKDTDADGVPDGLDKCAGTPKGAAIDAAGCPKDADGDGVADGIDKCPGTQRGTKVDVVGCPDLFAAGSTLVLEGVTFDFASDRLTTDSRAILDRVAAVLAANSAVRVEIGGHTDSVGADAANQSLSQRRAQAVRDYLISKGIAGERLTARGYGEATPIADNESESGRAKNRRVELKKQ